MSLQTQASSASSTVATLLSTSSSQQTILSAVSSAVISADHSVLIGQVSTAVTQLRSSITAAMSTVPNVNVVTPSGSPPAIGVSNNILAVQGNGLPISLEANCGTINPCDVLQALNSLKNLPS